jgi:hypothetical protein
MCGVLLIEYYFMDEIGSNQIPLYLLSKRAWGRTAGQNLIVQLFNARMSNPGASVLKFLAF